MRGPLETCPGCRITFAVPAAIAAARAGALDLALKHEEQCAYLADVVMRLPAWYAAHDEVLGTSLRPAAAQETTPLRASPLHLHGFAKPVNPSTPHAVTSLREKRCCGHANTVIHI